MFSARVTFAWSYIEHPADDAIAATDYKHDEQHRLSSKVSALKSMLYSGRMTQFFERFLVGPVAHFDYTWLRTVARRVAIDHGRRVGSGRLRAVPDGAEQEHEPVFDAAEQQRWRAELEHAMRRVADLEPQFREPLLLESRLVLSFELPAWLRLGRLEIEADSAYQLLPDNGLVFSGLGVREREALQAFVTASTTWGWAWPAMRGPHDNT